MSISNQSKPSTSIANATAPGEGLTWAGDLLTWAAELRTWAETGVVMNNTSRISSSMTNQVKPS